MPLPIHAFKGMSKGAYTDGPGWSPTNAAAVLAILLAKYSDFGWPEIEEFKRLNEIEDWEPDQELNADGTLIAQDGNIYLPDGFDLTGWKPFYTDWKAGYKISELPPRPIINVQPSSASYLPSQPAPTPPAQNQSYDPDNGGWNAPEEYQAQPQPGQPAAYTPQAAPSQPGLQPATYSPQTPAQNQKPQAAGSIPPWVWLAGAIGGGVIIHNIFSKKKGRK